MAWLRALLRYAGYALWALPLAGRRIPTRLRVPRRMLGESVLPHKFSLARSVLHSLLSGGVGLLAWFLAFLAVIAAIRGICYPLVASGNLEGSWGGPTLAGAWAVHALLGVGLLPVWLLVLAGLGAFQVRLTRGLLGRNGPWWPAPIAVALAAGGALLFFAWLRQV
ncbi:hypothetical protein [Nocardia amamiensis]|uniref:hypothetical protein n=1 Tax=Nocardia amamiensis TaxID=404578 RepID=UPI0008379088|nr:hypothetical protein [Nocardia amamiensis]